MRNKLVSIIIPVYNGERYIERCIKSIREQEYSNIEIVFIDDNSDDRSYNIISEYMSKDKRIKLFKNVDKGVSSARNMGILKATGDYISFVDCDDTIENKIYVTMVEAMEKNKVEIVKCCYSRIISGNKIKGQVCSESKMISSDELLRKIMDGNINSYVWLLLIDSKLLKNNDIKFEKNLKIMEDKDFYVNMLNHVDKVFEIKDALYNYYIYDNSSMRDVSKANERINEILETTVFIEKKLNNDKQLISGMCNSHMVSIIEQLCVMEINHIKCDYGNLLSNRKFSNICNNTDYKNMRTDNRILCKLFKSGHIRLMVLYYRFIRVVKKCIRSIKK